VSGPGVLLVDLRDDAARPSEAHVYETLRNLRYIDSGLVVVLDDVANLVDHHGVYQTLLSSPLVQSLIRVAVGPPAGRAAGRVLVGTPVLDADDAVTLWVGDPDGVGWSIHDGQAVSAGAVPDARGPALDALLEALQVPDVFTAVVALAGRFAGRVACPGHLVVAGLVGPSDLAVAQAAAIRGVAGIGARPGPAGRPELDDELARLLGGDDGGADQSARIVPGPLLAEKRDCVRQLRQVDEDVTVAVGRSWPALGGLLFDRDVWQRLVDAGAALGNYRDHLERLFRLDGAAGLTDQARAQLRSQGVIIDAPEEAANAALTDRLRDQVTANLSRGHSLSRLRDWLLEVAERAAPVRSAQRTGELAAACPDSTLRRLTSPPAFPWRPSQPWVLALVAATCFLVAVAGPLGSLLGPVLAACWAAGVALAVFRRPAPSRASQPEATPPAMLILGHLVLAGAAAGIGIAVRLAVGASGLPGPWVVPLAVVGAATLLVTMHRWWSKAVRSWMGAVDLADGEACAEALHATLSRVVFTSWALGDARAFVSDAARGLAHVLGNAVDVLGRYADLEFARPPDRPAPGSGVQSDLDQVMADDLADLVAAGLAPYWDRLRVGGGAEPGAGVEERLEKLLVEYRRHLELVGIDTPPVFGRESAARTALTSILWQRSGAVERILRDPTPASLMVQLCSADDLLLLEPDQSRIPVVRFIPRAAQPALAGSPGSSPGAGPSGAASEAGVHWTAGGHLAGALRLVPLRAGAVQLTWPASDGRHLL
jgi:hypothetical protein